jgi:hypothetical protein
MATYYWVGGNGNWGASETTNWASSSGGAGGAGFPTPYDNVVFDANSNTGTAAFAVTVTGVAAAPSTCANFDASAVDGVMTLTLGATGYLACYGSWVNPASNFAFSLTTGHTILFGATSLGKTVNLNNVSAVGINITFSGVGGGWTLAGAVNSPGASGAITVTSGSFDTGNQTISLGQFNATGTTTRSVTLGSSTITLGGTTPWNAVSTGLTFSAGTSTIACSSASAFTFAGGGLTYYNVSFTDSTGVSNTITLTGANIYNNLTATSPSVPGIKAVSLGSSQTVNGTLTLGSGGTASNRIWVNSSTLGAQRTITAATLAAMADVDFRDTIAAGAASPFTGTRIGNRGNNSNITFTAAKTVYWSLVGGGNWSDTVWATSSGGAPAANNFPLAQDTAIIDATGLNNASTITINADIWAVGTLNVTKTGAFTLACGIFNVYMLADVTLQPATIVTGSASWVFAYQGGTQTLTTNNASVTVGINLSSVGGTLQLGSAFTSSLAITVSSGTFNTANYNVNISQLLSSNSNTRTVSLGSSTVTIAFGTPVDFSTTTGLTFNAGTSTIVCSSNATMTFAGNGLTFYNVSFTGTTVTTTITITGTNNTFNNLTFTSPATAGYKPISIAANQTINGTFSPGTGGTATSRVRVRSNTFGTARTITAATLASTSDVDFRDIIAAGAAAPFTGTRIGNDNGNSNITFTAAKTVYWNLAGAQNWSATAWAATSGGAPAVANFPLPQDTATFDNTGSVTGTISFDTAWSIGTLNVTKTGAMTLALGTNAPSVLGSVTLQAATIVTGTGVITFTGTGTQVLTSNNCSFAPPVTLSGIGGTVQLGSNFTTSGTAGIVHTYGTLDLNNFNLTAAALSSSNTNTRAILLGSGTHTFSGVTAWDVSTTTGLTVTCGTSTIVCSNAAALFAGGGLTYYNSSFTSSAPGTVSVQGANTYNTLLFTSPATAINKTVAINNNLNMSTLTLGVGGTATNRITFVGFPINNQFTVTAATLSAMSDVDFRDIAAAGAAAPFTGTRIGNQGGNSGITFTAAKTVYWNLAAGGTWQSSTAWATSSGGAPAIANYPLPQDTAIIDDTGITTGNTITITSANAGTLNVTKTNAVTLACGSTNINFAGGVTLQSATVVTGTSSWSFYKSSGTPVLSTNGSVLPVSPIFNGGNLQLGTAVTTTGAFTLTAGALDLNNYTLTAATFSSNNSNTRSIAFGTTGNITVTGNNTTVFTIATATNFSFTGTSAVNLTYSGSVGTRTITSGNTAGATESNVMNFNISAGGDIVSFTTTCEMRSLNLTGFAGAIASTNKGIFGNFTTPSTVAFSVGTSTTSFKATTGTQVITTNGVVLDFNVVFSGTATYQLAGNFNTGGGALTSSTTSLISGTIDLNGYVLSAWAWGSNYSSTRAIAFNGGSISIIGNNQNVWSMATITNFTYTGTSVINFTYAGSAGTRTVTSGNTAGGLETNALNFNFTAGTDIISITSAATVRSLNFTGFAGTYTPLSKNIYGNFTMPAGVTVNTGTAANSFVATSGTQVITTNGVVQDYPITFANTTTVQLGGNLTVGPSSTAITTFTTGTLDLNGYVLSTHTFSSTNTNARVLAFNSGSITLTGNNATVFNMNNATNFTYTGTSVINLTYSGSVGTRSIDAGTTGVLETNALNFNVTAGSDILSLTAIIKNANLTGFSGTLSNYARTIYGNFTTSSGMTVTAGTLATTFAATSGTQTITTNGKTLDFPLTFNGAAATVYQFADALTQGSTRAFTLTLGIIKFKASTTNVVGSFVTSGTTQKYLQSDTAGTQATISQASGTVNANYLTLQDNNATGGATFNAFTDAGSSSSSNNVNNGNVTGWNFIPDAGGFLMLFPLDS